MSITPGYPGKGTIIAGKFQVEDVLGRGGMGVVLSATHLVLGRRVAVKFLLPEAMRVPDAAARFLREARAAVAIQSEHVARVIDVGTLDGGPPYLVMEFLAGTDLSRLLKRSGPLAIADAVDFVLQAGEAIAEAHALGIIHRDLKPQNLFLTRRAEGSPLVKVLDFGLSKATAPDDSPPETSLTATGVVMGSPPYMSPEQVRSLKDVDWRTDIWALGVILYELMTGARPFQAPSLTALSACIVADAPRSARERRPEIPKALEAAVMCCLEKDVARRTRSVGELAQAIAPFAPARSGPSIERIVRLSQESRTIPEASSPAVPAITAPSPQTTTAPPDLLPLTAAGSAPPSLAGVASSAERAPAAGTWEGSTPVSLRPSVDLRPIAKPRGPRVPIELLGAGATALVLLAAVLALLGRAGALASSPGLPLTAPPASLTGTFTTIPPVANASPSLSSIAAGEPSSASPAAPSATARIPSTAPPWTAAHRATAPAAPPKTAAPKAPRRSDNPLDRSD
jgi:serine/threonine-protein kinase